jgi:membrane protease YdiL (CAAX protease family)
MEERPLGYGVTLGWAFAATVVMTVAGDLLGRLRPAARSDLVTLGALEAAVLLLATFAVLRVHCPERPVRAALGIRPTHPSLVALSLALGMVLPVPAESLRQLVEQRYPVPERELVERALLFRADSTAAAVGLVLTGACLAPLVEELFFRGALFGALRRGQPLAGAVIGTTVAFVLTHLEPRAWPSLVLVGLALGYVRALGGSLLPSLALHVGYAAVGALALLSGVSSVAGGFPLSAGLALGGWAAALLLAFALQWFGRDNEEAQKARAEDEA